jgi:RNA recognition motif-containing protein
MDNAWLGVVTALSDVPLPLCLQAGRIQSVRVLRDLVTRRSLCYAYVNFVDAEEADRARTSLNGTPINGKPCRVMPVSEHISREYDFLH